MTEIPPLTFGRMLQARRLELGLRLQDIAEKTRISLPVLEHIEIEEHRELPAEAFVRGFVRAYARAVGLPPEELVQAYNLHLQQEREAMRYAGTRRRGGQARRTPRLRILALACVVVTGLAAALAWRLQLIPFAPKAAPAPATTSTEPAPMPAPPPAVTPAPATAPAPAPAPAAAPRVSPSTLGAVPAPAAPATAPPAPGATAQVPVIAKAFRLTVQAIADSRMKLMIDRKESRDVSLRPGDRLEFEASHGFSVLLANASAVQLTLNGQPVKIPVTKGSQAVTLQLP